MNPFLDAESLMRARGRLIRSKDLSDSQKQPTILDSNHHVTEIFFRTQYLENHRIGIEQLRSIVQQTYWIFGVRNEVKQIEANCVPLQNQEERVSPGGRLN